MTDKEWQEHPFTFNDKGELMDFEFSLSNLAEMYEKLRPMLDYRKNLKDCVLTYNDMRLIYCHCKHLCEQTSFFELTKEDVENKYKRFEEK